MAIDQYDIASTLRFMGDPELRQYAAMHKNDPYIFPLAFQESQNRQRLRMSQQGAQGMQPQPKVADQALAQMAPQQLPEDVGIGALDAPNMKFGAEGGIMGYEGYDEGPSTFGQEPVMMMAEGGIARYQVGGVMGDMPGYTPGATPFMPQAGAPEELPFFQRIMAGERERVAKMRLGEAQLRVAQGRGTETDYAIMADAQRKADASAPPTRRADYETAQPAAPTVAPAPAEKPAPTVNRGAAPRPATGRVSSAPTGIAAAAAAKDDPFSMSSVKKAQDEAMGNSKYQIGALNNQLVEIKNRAETQMQQRLDERKKEVAEEGDVYKDRSDRLVERAKGLAAQKNENQGLALLNAGLAIMSTPGSLATAIGKGAQVGTAQYAAGIKDLRAAQERLDEANERIAELRLNRKDLNSREIRALEKDRDNAILDGQKMVFGFAKDVYGMDRKQAESAFASYMSGQEKKSEIQSRERVAGMQEGGANARSAAQIAASLNTPDRALWDQLMKKNGNDATKALEEFKQAKGDKFDVRPLYAEHIKDAAKSGLPSESLATYAARFGATLPR